MTHQGDDGLSPQLKSGNQHHKSWRHQVVSDILGHKLSAAELQQALRICDEEFATDEAFSASEFCSLFTASTPSAKLDKQTRILFLQNARLPSHDQEKTASADSQATALASPPCSTATPHSQGESDRRVRPRKFTNLSGSYRRLEGDQERLAMVIENLSTTGARIHLNEGGELKRGDMIRVEFTLDDTFHTSIRLKSEVRWALADMIGVEFICPAGLPNILTNYIQS